MLGYGVANEGSEVSARATGNIRSDDLSPIVIEYHASPRLNDSSKTVLKTSA
jgi:hypothetical protein